MAINPMQRKSRNSFLLGMFIMLVVLGVVISILFMKMTDLNKQLTTRKNNTAEMLVLKKAVKSGDVLKVSDFEPTKIETTADKSSMAIAADFNAGDGTNIIAKIDLPKGIGLLKNMITTDTEGDVGSRRVQEYNMISLPRALQEGEYIDIRLRLPSGHDYIVVSKKYILETSEKLVKVNMSEEEIITMSNAIVEAYYIPGSKIYATIYSEPGIQAAATPTYPVSKNIGNLINSDPNVVTAAKQALNDRYNGNQRDTVIENIITQYQDSGDTNVQKKVTDEITKALEDRTKYLQSLNGK